MLYLSHIYFQIFLYKHNRFLHFHVIPAALLLKTLFFSFQKKLSLLRALLRIHKTFTPSLPLYISCLFSMLLNDDIVDTKKPDGICLLTFVADK